MLNNREREIKRVVVAVEKKNQGNGEREKMRVYDCFFALPEK